MHFTNGSEKKFQLQPDVIIIAHSQNQTSFFYSEGTETVSFYLTWPRYHEEKFLIKLTRRNADGQNVHHQRITQSVQAVHPCMRALSSDFVVLSSASERPETELFQCRCSLKVFVTEDSSVKTKRGKLSVEMTDQPFVTK